MHPSLFIAFFSGIFNLYIGIYLFLKNPKNNINRLFILFVISVVIFNISEFFTRLSTTTDDALFWGRLSYSFIWLSPCFALHFSLVFPRKFISKHYNLIFKYLLPSIYLIGLFIYLLFIRTLSIQNVQETEYGYRVILSRESLFIVIWLVLILILMISILVYNYIYGKLSRLEKKQIKVLLAGTFLLGGAGLGTNLLPPLFNFHIFPMTSLLSLVFIIIIGYSIIRYKFLSISHIKIANNILNTMKDLIIITNEKGEIIDVNDSTLKLLNYKKNELMNVSLNKIIKLHEEGKNGKKYIFDKIFERSLINKDFVNLELKFLHKNGKTSPMSVSISAIYNINKKIEGIIIVARDLTEIKKSIREKELLLREIHHRVKNNLQLISSMLDLQSEQDENKLISEKFKESQNRIKLMASLHEQLYKSDNLSKINFGEHIQVLSNILLSSYNVNKDNVTIKVNIRDIYMGIDMALLCSLIVNELISNSLKYAFPEGNKGEIIVALNFNGIKYSLNVSDNGIGFPTDVDFKNTKTLGLQLVNMFVKQLKGDIDLNQKRGTKFMITFKSIEREKGVFED